MAARTLAQIDTELTAVSTAITGILTGAQSTRAADGRMLTHADLAALTGHRKALLDERSDLERRTRREADGSILVGEV
jgi:hypothetical protein